MSLQKGCSGNIQKIEANLVKTDVKRSLQEARVNLQVVR